MKNTCQIFTLAFLAVFTIFVNMASKPKYAPINGAENPQIELVDQIERGPSQFNTKQILETVATPRSGSYKRMPTLQRVASAHLPVQDRIWNRVNKAVFWVYLALAVASLVLMLLGMLNLNLSLRDIPLNVQYSTRHLWK